MATVIYFLIVYMLVMIASGSNKLIFQSGSGLDCLLKFGGHEGLVITSDGLLL